LFSTKKEITHNPSKNCLLPKVKLGNVMTYIPDIENTQMCFDDESSKTDKLSQKMHSFVTRKKNKHKEKIYLGNQTKHDEFTFSPKEKDDDNNWKNWITNRNLFEINEIKKMMMIKIQEDQALKPLQ
jgi:hypothetical protein